MPDRGIAYHSNLRASDICAALINLQASTDDFQIITFEEVIGECCKMFTRAKGIKKLGPEHKALFQKWMERTSQAVLLDGARLYEKRISHRVAVPISAKESPLFNGAILDEYEMQKALNAIIPNRNSPALGHAFFIKDCGHPVMIRWLELRNGQTKGNINSHVSQIKDASSDPATERLETMKNRYNEAAILALPKPKEE